MKGMGQERVVRGMQLCRGGSDGSWERRSGGLLVGPHPLPRPLQKVLQGCVRGAQGEEAPAQGTGGGTAAAGGSCGRQNVFHAIAVRMCSCVMSPHVQVCVCC